MKYSSVVEITQAIIEHEQNVEQTGAGHLPLFTAHKEAKILIIGQAPGLKTEAGQKPWADKSGEQLRRWLGVTEADFYDEQTFALVPMDFYYPGRGKSGDLPPRKEFAELWHPPLLELMFKIQLTILIGQYSQAYYLKGKEATLTETVQNYKKYLKYNYFPLPHPSPRNNIWKKKNPWFEKTVVPALQCQVAKALR